MANIVIPQNHHPGCVPNLQRPSGFDGADRHNEFLQRYIIVPAFNVECLGCCYAYLTVDRLYRQRGDQSDFVDYNPAANPPEVACFVRVPSGGGVNGQIYTDKDMDLGNPRWRPFDQSRTFQMYSVEQLNVLSIGAVVQVTTRKESVSIDVVQVAELSAVHMNYADASLAEIYRFRRGKQSLRGFCSKRSDVEASGGTKEEQPPEASKVDVDTAASKLEDMTIKTKRSDVEASGGTKEEQPPEASKVDVVTAASKLEDMTIKTKRSDVEASGGIKEEQPPEAPKVDVDTAASKLEDMTIKTE